MWGPITPKWIGSYEEELHQVISEIIEAGYERIVDVGAAEGYYAVGLALKCKSSKILSFDIDPIARWRQMQLSRLNEIENLCVGKYCSHATLSDILTVRSLLICDIEGYEDELVNPDRVPELCNTDVLVEIHPFKTKPYERVKENILQRFRESHDITIIPTLRRDAKKYLAKEPKLKELGEDCVAKALHEGRGIAQEWLWMKAKEKC